MRTSVVAVGSSRSFWRQGGAAGGVVSVALASEYQGGTIVDRSRKNRSTIVPRPVLFSEQRVQSKEEKGQVQLDTSQT